MPVVKWAFKIDTFYISTRYQKGKSFSFTEAVSRGFLAFFYFMNPTHLGL